MSDLEKHSGGCACGKVRYHSIGKMLYQSLYQSFTNKSNVLSNNIAVESEHLLLMNLKLITLSINETRYFIKIK